MLYKNLENMEDQLEHYYPFSNSRIDMTIEKFSKAIKKIISWSQTICVTIASRNVLMQKKNPQQVCFLWNFQNIKFIQSKVKSQRYR